MLASGMGFRRVIAGLASFCIALAAQTSKAPFRPDIPKVWQTAELERFDVPLSQPRYSPHHVSEDYYYRIPEALVYKNYPVYAPGRAPAGYLESLKRRAP